MNTSGDDTPLLVLIHGWSCRADFWRQQLLALVPSFRVVTLDLAGHGKAPAVEAAETPSMVRLARDVVALVDRSGADSVGLVGHSMGGAVAIEAALQLKDRCAFILGVDTFNEAAFYGRRPADEIAARRRSFEQDFAGTMRTMVRAITAPDADPAAVAWIGDAMAASDPDASLAVLEQLLGWDIAARWPLLTCPVETINSAMLAERNELLTLDGLIVHPMHGVGHFPMLEKPDAFNELALAILEQRLIKTPESEPAARRR